MSLQITSPSPMRLVLSTHFIKYLQGQQSGGLPNDFVTNGSSALLLFDEILCESSALENEITYKDRWLSSRMFAELKDAGLLVPTDLKPHMPQNFLKHLDDSGINASVQMAMQNELEAFKKNPSKPLQMLPMVSYVNQYMFMGLDVPNALRYSWQESHFRVAPQAKTIVSAPIQPPDTQRKIERDKMLLYALKNLLPEFQLLPALSQDTEAYKALKEVTRLERSYLCRSIYGDPSMTHDVFDAWRFSPALRALDKKIDDSRSAQAMHNFDLLMQIRSETSDLRSGVQRIVADVVDGKRTVKEVQKELDAHSIEMMSFLPGTKQANHSIFKAGTGMVVSVAEVLFSLLGGISPISPIISIKDYWSKREEQQQLNASHQQYPLFWFIKEYNDVRTRDNKNILRHKPRLWPFSK